MKRWLAFDIGCIECGEESAVIGVYMTRAEAETACNAQRVAQKNDWHGQHEMQVFDLLEWLPGTGAGVTPENAPSREGDAAPGPDYKTGCAKCGKRTCDESCCDVCSDPQCPHNNQPL